MHDYCHIFLHWGIITTHVSTSMWKRRGRPRNSELETAEVCPFRCGILYSRNLGSHPMFFCRLRSKNFTYTSRFRSCILILYRLRIEYFTCGGIWVTYHLLYISGFYFMFGSKVGSYGRCHVPTAKVSFRPLPYLVEHPVFLSHMSL